MYSNRCRIFFPFNYFVVRRRQGEWWLR